MSLDKEFLQSFGGLEKNCLRHVMHYENVSDPENVIETIHHSPYYDSEMLVSTLDQKRNCFTILSTNIQSVGAKFSELEIFVNQLHNINFEFSAICIQESGLNDGVDLSQLRLNGYTCISQGKSASQKGGLIVYLLDKYDYKVKLKFNKSEIWEGQFLEIYGGGLSKHLIIGNVYRPPREPVANYKQFTDDIVEILSLYENLNMDIVLTGDTNVNLLKINKKEVISDFLDSIMNLSYFPKITLPTRFTDRTGSLIDNFFCKLSLNTADTTSGIMIKKFSDHQPYFLCLNKVGHKHDKDTAYVVKRHSPKDYENFTEEIKKCNVFDQLDKNPNANPNANFNMLNRVIMDAKDKHLSRKLVKFNKHKHRKSKWITQGIVKSITFRDKLYKKMKLTPPDTELFHRLKTNLKTYNMILKESIRAAKKNYYESCFKQYKDDIRKTWSTINDILCKNKNNKKFPDFFKENEDIIRDKIEIASKFNVYFTNIGPRLAQEITTSSNKTFKTYLTKRHDLQFKFHSISQDNVTEIIDKLKAKTSSGWDGLSVKLMKFIKSEIIPSLTLIINQMLHTGIFPDDLKIAKVIPLFKKDDDKLFTNYRPISLLPSLSKVFEKVIFIQMYDFFQAKKLFYKSQYGFRSEHSTELATLELVNTILKQMDNDDIPFSIFLDLSKAFDTLDHKILTEKLVYYGFEGTPVKLIQNYLGNRKQFVEYCGTQSDTLDITTGVPQGSVLGPLLFIIYMNDIASVSDILESIIYADDTTLSSTFKAFGIAKNATLHCQNINDELEKVNVWLKLNKLSLNVKKSRYMIFHAVQRQVSSLEIKINGIEVQRVQDFNFLGIML